MVTETKQAIGEIQSQDAMFQNILPQYAIEDEDSVFFTGLLDPFCIIHLHQMVTEDELAAVQFIEAYDFFTSGSPLYQGATTFWFPP